MHGTEEAHEFERDTLQDMSGDGRPSVCHGKVIKGSILGRDSERYRNRLSRARHALLRLLEVTVVSVALEPQPTSAGISALRV